MIVLEYPIVGGEYKISQPFGTNPDGYPNFYAQFGYIGHNGIDFYGIEGDYIFSTCDGHVITAHYDNTGYGNLTVIVDDEGGQHYYAHQSKFAVKVGDNVKIGNLIGYMGHTGNVIGNAYSDGTHLHYGYRPPNWNKYNGYGGFIDPLPYFKKEELPDYSEQQEAQEQAKKEHYPYWAEVVCELGANVRPSAGSCNVVTWLPKGVRVHIVERGERKNDIFPQGIYEVKKFLEVCRDNNIDFRIKAYHTMPHWTWYYQANC